MKFTEETREMSSVTSSKVLLKKREMQRQGRMMGKKQPLPSSRPPSTRRTNEVEGGTEEDIVVEGEEVNSVHSIDEWVVHILSGLRDPSDEEEDMVTINGCEFPFNAER